MPIYDYECKCGEKKEAFGKWGDTVKCPSCKNKMKRVLSGKIGISMGVGAYGYYDENLQAYVNTNADKKRIMEEQGVSESYGKGWI